MIRNTGIFIVLVSFILTGSPLFTFSQTSVIVDSCFSTTSPGHPFPGSTDIYNTSSADVAEWTGSAWTGQWSHANVTLAPPCTPTGNCRAFWIGASSGWTTGGEGFGLRLNNPLVTGVSYSFTFTYVSHGTASTGSFAPNVYTNTSGALGGANSLGALPAAGTAWTTNTLTFTASAAQNGDNWIILHTGTSTGSGMVLSQCCCTVVNPNSVTATATPSTICEGESSTLNATAGLAGSTYTWSTGATGSSTTVSPTTTTTYTVTVDDGGQTASTSVTVTVNPLPTVTATASPSSICTGNSSTLTASGASTYSWSTGATGSSISVSPASTTTYTVTGTSAAGCSNTASVTVTVSAVPNVTATASPGSICPGGSSTLTAGGATTYTWSTGATGSPISVSPGTTTTYTVTGSSGPGCSNTASVDVIVNPAPTITVADQIICDGETATLTASGAAIYSWSTGGSNSSISVSPSSTTTYTVTGTNAVGCTGTTSATVTVNPLPNIAISANPASVCPGNNSILTASGGTNYTWSTSGTGTSITVNPTSTTTYSVTGTDANGCSNTADINVTVLPGPVVTTTGATICEGETANITASGATNYVWDNSMTGSSINVSPTSTTTYTVSGTDGSGCTGIATAIVTVNPLPTITSTDDEICEGETATISAAGGNTYSWSSGGTNATENVSPTTTTTYYVTGTDANGCSNTSSSVVTVNDAPFIGSTNTTADYCDSGNGTASVSPTGGTTPYLYNWSTNPAQTSNPAIDLTAGTYTVTVTDDNGCSSTASVTVSAQAGFTLSSSSEAEHCEQMDGIAQVIVTGAVNPVNYSWSHDPGVTTDMATGLSSGVYTVTVDDGQCVRTIDITVGSMAGPTAGFFINPTQLTMDDPTISVIDQSVGATTYYYETGDGNSYTSPSYQHSYGIDGEYVVMQIVYDDFGCTDTMYQTVIVNESFAIYIPNAFSPNGDGRNDYWHPSGIGIDPDTWHMRIYDRWGHTVFVTTDINKAWNGNFNGDVNECSQGVYSYHIIFKTTTGKDKEYFGRVTKLP